MTGMPFSLRREGVCVFAKPLFAPSISDRFRKRSVRDSGYVDIQFSRAVQRRSVKAE